MRVIVNKKSYDTKLDRLVFSKANKYEPESPRYRVKHLYRNDETGDFFIFHDGGPENDIGDDPYIEVVNRHQALRFLVTGGGEEVALREGFRFAQTVPSDE